VIKDEQLVLATIWFELLDFLDTWIAGGLGLGVLGLPQAPQSPFESGSVGHVWTPIGSSACSVCSFLFFFTSINSFGFQHEPVRNIRVITCDATRAQGRRIHYQKLLTAQISRLWSHSHSSRHSCRCPHPHPHPHPRQCQSLPARGSAPPTPPTEPASPVPPD
jgi:hypothetical protein